MDKLHELLNEFHLQKWERITIAWPEADISEKEINALEATLISKKYWFIKWLVENGKLKWTNKMEQRKIMLWMPEKQDYYLMMLAVHPEPLEFLSSILK